MSSCNAHAFPMTQTARVGVLALSAVVRFLSQDSLPAAGAFRLDARPQA